MCFNVDLAKQHSHFDELFIKYRRDAQRMNVKHVTFTDIQGHSGPILSAVQAFVARYRARHEPVISPCDAERGYRSITKPYYMEL